MAAPPKTASTETASETTTITTAGVLLLFIATLPSSSSAQTTLIVTSMWHGVWAHLVRGVHESLRLVPASGPPGDESLTSSPCALRVTFDPRGCVGHEHGETLPQKQRDRPATGSVLRRRPEPSSAMGNLATVP